MNVVLRKIEARELELFRREMKNSFQQSAFERFNSQDAAPIPPENEVDEAFADERYDVFIIDADGIPAGGTIIKKEGKGKYSLDLLFVFKEFINKKIGTAVWQIIEKHYPDAEIWETCTPYFDRRNIHFYVNKCGFKITEFYCEYHREEHDLTEEFKDVNSSGFFRFEKVMKQ
ncbi:MAG: GNAT family N-acetyltransferase [Lentisphaerae bacterium]|nr:GNAT family N-acetyltransferase [Lentisphaerota bacterium]MBR2871902.1 GNAT family N-acetyltransferase [Lentisphaeria bacterium]